MCIFIRLPIVKPFTTTWDVLYGVWIKKFELMPAVNFPSQTLYLHDAVLTVRCSHLQCSVCFQFLTFKYWWANFALFVILLDILLYYVYATKLLRWDYSQYSCRLMQSYTIIETRKDNQKLLKSRVQISRAFRKIKKKLRKICIRISNF